MSDIGTWGGGVASIIGGISSVMAGNAKDASASYTADQLDTAALAARASAQRQSFEESRKGRLLNSALQARAGAADVGTTNLAAGIAEESEYRALLAMYEGESEAAGLTASAQAKRYEGRSAKWAGGVDGLTSFLQGGTSLYSKYGAGGPSRFTYEGAHDLKFTNRGVGD